MRKTGNVKNGERASISKTVSFLINVLLAAAVAVPFSPAPSQAADAVEADVTLERSPVRFEFYHTGQESTGIGYHSAQTFTPAASHVVKQIKLKLWNNNIFLNGILTVGVTRTDINGRPTGDFLASGNIASTLIADFWTTVTIDLGTGCEVFAGTKYAIRIDSPDQYEIYALVDTSNSTYSGGNYLSANRKATYWVDRQAYDIWFEEWGVSSGTVPPSVLTTGASDVGTTSAIIEGTLISSGSAFNLAPGFELGPSTKFGTVVSSQLSDNGTFTANVSGLTPNTLYHFRAVASDPVAGTSYGAYLAFTTSTGSLVRFESYSGNQDSTGIGWHAAQTFTPQDTHVAKQIKLKLWNHRLTSGNLTVGISGVDFMGLPAGRYLATGTIAATSIADGWTTVTVDLGAGCLVNKGTTYAIRIDSPDQDAIYAMVDVSGAAYSGGRYLSANRDMSWWVEHDQKYDIWFEEWGEPYEEPIIPTVNSTAHAF